jgi:hypothetical protein
MPSRTVNLSRPLTTHKGDIKAITFKDPTARDFIEMGGLPVRVWRKMEGGEAAVEVKIGDEDDADADKTIKN